MQKKFRISVDGKSYNVVVEDLSGDQGGAMVAAAPAVAYSAPVAAAAAAPAQAEAAPAWTAPAGGGDGDQVSPLNGVLVSIDVKMGQDVKESDPIATIESMKMKTTAFAKSAGKVVNIAVKAGDPLEAGQVLLTLG